MGEGCPFSYGGNTEKTIECLAALDERTFGD